MGWENKLFLEISKGYVSWDTDPFQSLKPQSSERWRVMSYSNFRNPRRRRCWLIWDIPAPKSLKPIQLKREELRKWGVWKTVLYLRKLTCDWWSFNTFQSLKSWYVGEMGRFQSQWGGGMNHSSPWELIQCRRWGLRLWSLRFWKSISVAES